VSIREFLFSVDPTGHQETIPERRQRWFEIVTAVMLAVAAIAATWSSFEASQWSGKASGLVSSSSILRADSNREASKGAEETLIDASLWLEWEKSLAIGRDELAVFLRGRFSPALDSAQDEWLKGSPVDEAGNPTGVLPPQTPLTLDSYRPPGQQRAEALAARAEDQLAESSTYSAIAGKYVLLTVLFALVLVFGNVAVKFTSPAIQLGLGLITFAVLATGFVRLLLLPLL